MQQAEGGCGIQGNVVPPSLCLFPGDHQARHSLWEVEDFSLAGLSNQHFWLLDIFIPFLLFLASWGACILSGNFYSLFPLSPRRAFTERHYYSRGKWGQSMALCESRIAVASGFSFGGCQNISARNELAESYQVVIRGYVRQCLRS